MNQMAILALLTRVNRPHHQVSGFDQVARSPSLQFQKCSTKWSKFNSNRVFVRTAGSAKNLVQNDLVIHRLPTRVSFVSWPSIHKTPFGTELNSGWGRP